MKESEQPYWYNYISKINPQEIAKVVEERYITSRNRKLHLDIYNPQVDCPTVIFIHGTSVYSKFYTEFLFDVYKHNIRIVAIDLQGHGLSSGVRGHFTIDELVNNITTVASYVIWNYGPNLGIMGSSLGGILSLYTVAKDKRFRMAICHNFAILSEEASKNLLNLSRFMSILRIFLPITARIFPRFKLNVFNYLDRERLANTARSKELIEFLEKDPLVSVKYSLKSLYSQKTAPLSERIDKISTPVMLINGERDELFSIEHVSEIFQRLTCKKRVEIIPQAGHFIFHENQNESVKRIITWINDIFMKDQSHR